MNKTTIKQLIMNAFIESEYGETLSISDIAQKAFGQEYGTYSAKALERKIKNNINHAITCLRADHNIFIHVGKQETKEVRNKQGDIVYEPKNLRHRLKDEYTKCSDEQVELIDIFLETKSHDKLTAQNTLQGFVNFFDKQNLLSSESKLMLDKTGL